MVAARGAVAPHWNSREMLRYESGNNIHRLPWCLLFFCWFFFGPGNEIIFKCFMTQWDADVTGVTVQLKADQGGEMCNEKRTSRRRIQVKRLFPSSSFLWFELFCDQFKDSPLVSLTGRNHAEGEERKRERKKQRKKAKQTARRNAAWIKVEAINRWQLAPFPAKSLPSHRIIISFPPPFYLIEFHFFLFLFLSINVFMIWVWLDWIWCSALESPPPSANQTPSNAI